MSMLRSLSPGCERPLWCQWCLSSTRGQRTERRHQMPSGDTQSLASNVLSGFCDVEALGADNNAEHEINIIVSKPESICSMLKTIKHHVQEHIVCRTKERLNLHKNCSSPSLGNMIFLNGCSPFVRQEKYSNVRLIFWSFERLQRYGLHGETVSIRNCLLYHVRNCPMISSYVTFSAVSRL